MTTYPLNTLAPTIDSTGISAPVYSDIYLSLQASFQAIYGSSIYITPDSQDGQWLAVLAQAISDSNNAAIAAFQAFSPTYAQGAGLSSIVKINGLLRNVATNSTAVGNVIGQAGSIILAGIVTDVSGNQWTLPSSVTIPLSGSVSVTVTAATVGAIVAPAGTINSIANPQYGWQSFLSTSDAVVGQPVETDMALVARQSVSTSLPAQGIKEAMYSAIGNVPGVTRWTVYENDTSSTDINGVPANSFCCVIQGGTVSAIASAMVNTKSIGSQSYGTTSATVYDQYGLPTTVNYFVLASVPIYFAVTIKALAGYVSTTGTAIVAALVAYSNSLTIGEDVYQTQASGVASLMSLGIGQTFYITSMFLGIAVNPTGTADVSIAFNAAAQCAASNVSITVT